jgi:excisionase family DNA binding protein
MDRHRIGRSHGRVRRRLVGDSAHAATGETLRGRTDSQRSRELLTAVDLAELLGVHRSSIYRMLKLGQLPVERFAVGNELRFSRRQIERWLDGDVSVQGEATSAVSSARQRGASPEERRQRTIAASPDVRTRRAS